MNDRLEVYQSTARRFKIATSITVLDADPCGTRKTNETPRLEEVHESDRHASWTQSKEQQKVKLERAQRRLNDRLRSGRSLKVAPPGESRNAGVWPVSVGAAQVSPFRASNPRATLLGR